MWPMHSETPSVWKGPYVTYAFWDCQTEKGPLCDLCILRHSDRKGPFCDLCILRHYQKERGLSVTYAFWYTIREKGAFLWPLHFETLSVWNGHFWALCILRNHQAKLFVQFRLCGFIMVLSICLSMTCKQHQQAFKKKARLTTRAHVPNSVRCVNQIGVYASTVTRSGRFSVSSEGWLAQFACQTVTLKGHDKRLCRISYNYVKWIDSYRLTSYMLNCDFF